MSERICSEDNCANPTKARGYCSKHYTQHRRLGEFSTGTCRGPGCERSIQNSTLGLCQMHVTRFRRSGKLTLSRAPNGAGAVTDQGYHRLHKPDHPVAYSNGYALVHRLILWELTDGRDTECAWCHKPLSWDEGEVCGDHIDGDRQNNHPFNLVASCRECNLSRSHYLRGNATRLDRYADLGVSPQRRFSLGRTDV